MKKTFFALLVSSAFLLSACNEKELEALNQSLLESQKQVNQLKSDLTKSKNEVSQLTANLEQLKQSFPALNVKIETLFDKKEVIKHAKKEKSSEEDFIKETEVSTFVSTAKTGIQWLDDLLLARILEDVSREDTKESNQQGDKPLSVFLNEKIEKIYHSMYDDAKETPTVGMSYSIATHYLNQRHNIATFTQFTDTYTGGAHGVYHTQYVNIDVKNKKIIHLSDLFSEKQLSKVRKILWEQYVALSRPDEPFASEKDFRVEDNFYFDENGVVFVFPVYALASFAEGEQQLTLPWSDADQLINPDYKP